MRDDLQQLIYLQDFDQQISDINADLIRIPQLQEGAKDRLAADTAALEKAKMAYKENEVAIKNVELDIGTRKDSIAKLKTQQFETKKNEEFTKIGEDIIRYEEMVDELETNELELMELADGHREKIAAAEDALGKTQKLVDEEIAELGERLKDREASKAKLSEQRALAAAEIDEDLVSDYERLFKKHDGKAVCQVTPEKQCTGCHVKVTPTTFAAAKTDATIAECDNCGAMLYYGSNNPGKTEQY